MKALLDPRLNHRPLMPGRALLAAALAAALLLPVAVIHATASNGTGKISGTVRDPSGAVIPGAAVTADNLGSHDHIVVLSSRDGSFEFLAIPAGRYRLEVIEPGFTYAQSSELELKASGDLHQDISMQIEPASEEIVVHGQLPVKAQHTPPPTPRRIRVGGQVEAAKLINHVMPVYPASAEQQGIEGTVILRAVIGTAGQILSLTPYNDADPGLVKSATDAVHQWRYDPTLLNGDPVEVETTITVVFRLTP